ncbi:Ger(x)C family spore germination protein [Bacillus sp. B15-48]|uniref:Ger(x)C family spore germination protein n=1 Tax=Bacillus sp. B15-48 TaxID=1548601 RepID=UPI00193FF90B
MNHLLRIVLTLCALLLSACVNKEIIDDINIATGMGLDKSEDEIRGTIMIPVFQPDKSIDNFTFSATGTIPRETIAKMRNKSSQPIVGGSIEVIFFNEELARDGIVNLLDLFLRDPSIGARVYLGVVDGDVKEIFDGDYGDRGNAVYLAGVIEDGIRGGSLPLTNLRQFLFDYFQKGKDPYLPYLEKTEPDLVELKGLALFKEDKVVDILSVEQMFYLKLLVDRHHRGGTIAKIGEEAAVFKLLKTKKNFQLTNRNPYQFTIDLKLRGIVSEYTGRSLSRKEVNEIEKQLEKQVVTESMKIIHYNQNLGIDPIGFGHFANTKTRGFDFDKWEQQYYPNAEFIINADVTITEVGMQE